MEIPVYLFTGFLDAGKTRFLQGTLEDSRFNSGERTLVLLCEEGEEELCPEKFAAANVFIESVEREDLSDFLLQRLVDKHTAERVLIEYNGMWPLAELFDVLPEEFVIYEQFFFCDAATFLPYNNNMRQLMMDKLQGCELIVLNRTGDTTDKEQIHKIIRAANRRCDILYEYPDGSVEPDDREDPLPFDIDAPIIGVEDRDYALWYREVSEEPQKYQGKTFKIKGMVVKSPEIPDDSFILGRQVMTCCVQDIQFAGFICLYDSAPRLRHKSWAYVTAEIDFAYHPVYGQKGPLLRVREVSATSAPEQPVATFY